VHEPVTRAGYVLRDAVNHVRWAANWFRATMAYNVGPKGLKSPGLYRTGYVYAYKVVRGVVAVYNTRCSARRFRLRPGAPISRGRRPPTYKASRSRPQGREGRASQGDVARVATQKRRPISIRQSDQSRSNSMNIRNLKGQANCCSSALPPCAQSALRRRSPGTIDSSDNFYPLYQWVNANLSGGLGTSICFGHDSALALSAEW